MNITYDMTRRAVYRNRIIVTALDNIANIHKLEQMWNRVEEKMMALGFPSIPEPCLDISTGMLQVNLHHYKWNIDPQISFDACLMSPYVTGCDLEYIMVEAKEEEKLESGVTLMVSYSARIPLPEEYIAALHAADLVEWATRPGDSYQTLRCGGF